MTTNLSKDGIVEFNPSGFSNGAGSAREDVILSIQKENEQQLELNKVLGGSFKSKIKTLKKMINKKRNKGNKSVRKMVLKGKKKLLNLINKKNELSSLMLKLKSSVKRKIRKIKTNVKGRRLVKSNKNRTRRKYSGGEQEVEVPQFQSVDNGSDFNPNNSSVQLNGLLLKSKQDSIHDSKI